MGTYINKGNMAFREARNGEYIDKSGLIAVINGTIGSRRKFSCVSRSRRFGKSMAAEMLCAYYDQSCDSRELFADLEIARDPSFEQHLNKYPVIYLDMTRFTTLEDNTKIVSEIEKRVGKELRSAYPDVLPNPDDDMMDYMLRVVQHTGKRFIFIIDEWDAVCRIYNNDSTPMDLYVNWLRRMFKDTTATDCFAAVYMTGILPIKKYNTQSALNNFLEYSMVEPRQLARFFGFTKEEVRMLAERHGTDFDELVKWYDGYQIGDELSMFNPNSVIQAVAIGRCRSFWASTGAFDAVADYIQMNYEGLKDDIVKMLAGERSKVDPTGFGNDMS
ncbi:MAG: AAA family ATPase, partial [Bacteroidaceae bacterium]|nr:AAA family ATPase [Bacteroidaceae bacterium]